MPGLIAVIGLLFLLKALGALSESAVAIAWPVALMLIGLQKMARGMCKCCANH